MPRVRRRAHVVAQLHQIVADAPHAGLEEIALVLVVVDAEHVEVVAGEIDDFLAPRHVVRALLAAGDDHGIGSDLPQAAAVEIDDGGVALGREAVVHRLVVDLEVADAVRIGMSVARAHLPPRRRRRIVDVMHPVHRVLDRRRRRRRAPAARSADRRRADASAPGTRRCRSRSSRSSRPRFRSGGRRARRAGRCRPATCRSRRTSRRASG